MVKEKLQFGDLRIEGISRAGDETWFRVRPPGIAFDAGRGAVQLSGMADIFLTHGHLDHALGLPFLLSQRAAHGTAPTRIFAPAPVVEPLNGLIAAAEALEEGSYDYKLEPLEPGAQVSVGKNLTIEAFATDHVTPSLGYHLLRAKSRLRGEFQDRSGAELADLRRSGIDIEREEIEIWLSYCGDTGPGVFDLDPRVFESSVLLLECTFFDEESMGRAREFKHMHLDDLVERAGSFRNQELVLHHLSRRYRCSELLEWLGSRLELPNTRVQLFGC